MWSSSSNITCSTALVCPNELSTITGPNSSAKHSRVSVINSEYKICHQWHTIQLLMSSQKPSIKLLESFSRSLSRKVKVTGRQIKRMLLGLPTMVRTLTKVMPFFLVYGCEVVFPLEIQIPSLRVALTTRMMNEESIDCASKSWKL